MKVCRMTKKNVYKFGAAVSAMLFLAGCKGVTRLATEAIAGKAVADKIAQSPARSESEETQTSKAAQQETKKQNNDARVALGQHLHTTWMEFRTQPEPVQVDQEAVWTMNIWQVGKEAKNNNWVDEFKYVHEKLMHLIVVSKDLSYFNHVHPDFRGDGLFITSQTLPHGGTFKAYADYTPMRGVQEVAQHEFNVEGVAVKPIKLVPEVAVNGWMTKRIVSKPESQPDAVGGDVYHVGMMATPALVAEQPVMLHFRIRNGIDQPVTDLQPYLGAMGHAVILSADTKIYLHTHPMDESGGDISSMGDSSMADMGGMDNHKRADSSTGNAQTGGPDVIFHTVFPAAGLYKIWGQFQHQGRIITAPFVLNVAAK